jgi:hypothetical protein
VTVVSPVKPERKSAKTGRGAGSRGGGIGGGVVAGSGTGQTAGRADSLAGVEAGTFTQAVAAAGIDASLTGTPALGAPTGQAGAKPAKRVKLNLSYIAPLSVTKVAFLVSVAMGIAFVVAIYILWEVLNDRQIFAQIDDMITSLVGENRPKELDITSYVEQGRIMSGAAIIAVVDVIVFTVISTLVAVIYNIIAALVGGVRVTLKEN